MDAMRGLKKMSKVILVVEDDEDNSFLIDKILSNQGYEVKLAKTGNAGIEYCQDQKVDLILMDISLPDINGLEVTKKIRQMPGFESVPVIAITAYAMEDAAVQAGCTSYIGKPFKPNDLVNTIKKLLG